MSTDVEAALAQVIDPRAGRYVALAAAATCPGTATYRSAGVRHAEHGGSVDEHSVFEVGSITKTFTSLLLADQVVEGAVELDQPLRELYPELRLPVRGRPVTLADLATHTSGFPRLPKGLVRQAFGHGDDPYARFTEADVATALEGVRLRREPGSRVRYSNFGAAVLGNALARGAGTTYASLLEERVTGPLGLADTLVVLRPDQEQRRAHGHKRRGRPTGDWSMPALPAMGALHSTAADLARFLQAQLDPEATPLAAAIRMTHEPRAGRGAMRVGLGWMLTPMPKGGPTVHWHNGGTGGARSWAGFTHDTGTGVVVLTTGQRSPDRLGFDVLKRS